jgi:hypothetical protein
LSSTTLAMLSQLSRTASAAVIAVLLLAVVGLGWDAGRPEQGAGRAST